MNLEAMNADYFTEIVKTVINALRHIIAFIESHILETKFAYELEGEE